MAYHDEKPEVRNRLLLLAFVGVSVIIFVTNEIAPHIGVSRNWIILPAVLAYLILAVWLTVRRTKVLHLNDEFHMMRQQWSRSQGLGAAMSLLLLAWFILRHPEFLPADWARFVAAVLPHSGDFANGLLFACWTIIACVLAADGIWQLRHK
jgi:hypothetical protein